MTDISSRLELVLRLDDCRLLAYHRWNESVRHPLLFCHGTPGTRLFRQPDEAVLRAVGVDPVKVDRPGYGAGTGTSRWPA